MNRKDPKPCVVDGCDATAKQQGMCGRHYMRVKRYGNPHHVTSEADWRMSCRMAQQKLGKLKPTTYQKYLGRHLHRQVAEQKIGRPLRTGEIVHHIDGNKRNNHPDNLEVLASQSEHIRKHKRGARGRLSC